jgi:hypothetical protein
MSYNDHFKHEIRKALSQYIRSEGCSCCRNEDKHREAAVKLAELLDIPKYSDGSGYNFYKFSEDE